MNSPASTLEQTPALRLDALMRLGKPRVVALVVFTAVVGMLLATPGLPSLPLVAAAAAGIYLVATSAAALNCFLERRVDGVMARTRGRPLPRSEVTLPAALWFAAITGAAGLAILDLWVNPLTMWLTVGTFMGYAVVYTAILKPLTPQNIVIGGASGAMPPILGWAAATGGLTPEPLLLFLIIFVWTPPHFWALALYRKADYAHAGIPMLPVTHGAPLTRRFIGLYSLALAAVSLLPFAAGNAGAVYAIAVAALDARFCALAWKLWRTPSDAHAIALFRFSIQYLALLFAAALADHYLVLG
jgi:protoheme IX farnesyltransferase